MSVDGITPNQLTRVQNTTGTAAAAATDYVEAEEGLFETQETTQVNQADLNYIEKEVGVLESIGEKIGLDLTGDLETDFDALNEYPAKLDEMIQKIEQLIEQKLQELKDLEAQQARLLSDEAETQHQITNLNNQKLMNQAEQQELANKITNTTKANQVAQEEFQAMYNSELANAEAAYNPDTDGDKEQFIQNKLSGLGTAATTDVSSMQSDLSSLQSAGNRIDSTLGSLNTTLTSIQDKIQKVDIQITTIQTEIDIANEDIKEIEAEKATIPAKATEAVKNAVGPEEWKVIEESKIDLSATLQDGSPRYMLAKGSEDGKYHLYDLGTRDSRGRIPSVVRQNAAKGGFNIISKGNGYIKSYQKTEDNAEGSTKTFAFTIADTFKSTKESAKIKTESPLAFDLNANGIQTSDGLVNYDIDGDGQMDKVNNVLEGILAFDADNDGIAGEDGSELFGNNTDIDGDGKADGYKNGFEALKALAAKENLIDGDKDMKLDKDDIALLSEKYGLTMKMGYTGAAQSLESLGISEINLAKTNETTLQDNFDGKGNQLMTQEGATFVQNGEEKDYADVWNAKK